jgi:hypothetical protein
MEGTGESVGTATVSAPSTETSSSVSSTPTVTESTGSGTPAPPKDMAEGFRQALKAKPESPAAAPTAAAPDTSPPPKPQGPIPFERHQAAVENARRKAAEDTESRYAWAKSLDQSRVQRALEVAQRLDADPVAFVREAAQRLAKHPQYRERLMARPQEQRPQPDMATADGQYRFYSAEQQQRLIDWHLQQQKAEVQEMLRPIQEERQHSAEEKRTKAIQSQAQQTLAEAETWPQFKEHIRDIHDAMAADKRLGLEGAYNRVVVPQLAKLEREAGKKELLAEMEAKAKAGSANPNAPTTSPVTEGKSKSTFEGFRAGLRRAVSGS